MDLNIFPLFICKIPNNYSFQRILDFSFEIDISSNTTQFVGKTKKELRKKQKSVNQTGQKKNAELCEHNKIVWFWFIINGDANIYELMFWMNKWANDRMYIYVHKP